MVINSTPRNVDRLTRKVLTMYYLDSISQSEIAKTLSLSPAKVNRIIRSGREEGLVEINLKFDHADLVQYERKLVEQSGLADAVLCAALSKDPEVNLRVVAEAAADLLLEKLRDGDVICVSGGKAMAAIISAIRPTRKYDVTVVPATGGVQGKYYTDVNHLAYSLAEKLGGHSLKIHAPLFADTQEDRNVLIEMRSCKEVMDLARNADIALVGIGAVAKGSESYFDLRNLSDEERHVIHENHCVGEILAHLININGHSCFDSLNQKLVGLTIEELQKIPVRIGVATNIEKVDPIAAALAGKMVNTLVSDDVTAKSVLEKLKETAL
ncbi:transcriptional regulator [Hahella sp. CCB-MM4]|uniref:sugar-binding transcriptional regulator n=1 Tax=Hahella sp. (strain CCB-MM4) TaxID=1926491 RepID=UPI000BDDB700|nr:sugar-binding transcriptional regulator [Hahella sp. CCB-MM4]OZG70398.1 transcriptional regulator [Hahella sp. CCB-MM4]